MEHLEKVKLHPMIDNWEKRCVAEMFYIKKEKHSINKMTVLKEFPHIYSTVLK